MQQRRESYPRGCHVVIVRLDDTGTGGSILLWYVGRAEDQRERELL